MDKPTKPTYKCPWCVRKYRTIVNWGKHVHLELMTRIGNKCPLCKATFASRSRLAAHMLNRVCTMQYSTDECTYCDKIFQTHEHRYYHETMICIPSIISMITDDGSKLFGPRQAELLDQQPLSF